jgi:DNA-directed RNA polymerase specialized sigma24 family protein
VTAAPEPLRLFAAEDRTPPGAGSETPAELTRSQAQGELVQAARQLTVAHARFAKAVVAARHAGYSWRDIGMIAGFPYQTLHRRFRPGDNEGTMRQGDSTVRWRT